MDQPTRTIDPIWIRAVVNQYERPLVLYATRLIGDLERARDVVQETFLKLCRQERGKVEPYLVEWLYTVCRNKVLDVRRKESRMVRLAEGEAVLKADTDASPGAAIEADEIKSRVLDLIGHLPEKQQEAIRLKFQHALSYRQISKVMELTTSYVGYLIHAGLKAMREKLALAAGEEKDTGPIARISAPARLSKDQRRDAGNSG